MSEDPPPEHPRGHVRDTTPPNPMPFVIALVGILVVAVVAFVFLRADDEGELVRPDRLSEIDDDTIRAVALHHSSCDRIIRAQVEPADEAIFVELVVEGGDEDCVDAGEPLEAEITLPEPVDGRELRPGVGRVQIPCDGSASPVTCQVDR